MAKLKRLVDKNDSLVEIEVPVSESELLRRKEHYETIPPNRFATKFRGPLFQPVNLNSKGQKIILQMNCCINPYCKNFGLSQVQYDVKGKPQRYKLSNSYNTHSRIICNPDPVNPSIGIVWGCSNTPLSNWAIAEEIKRIAEINSVTP